MRTVLKILVALTVVLSAAGGAFFLIRSRRKPERVAPPAAITLVEASPVSSEAVPVVVPAMGEVIPARSLVVQPEVAGRVIRLGEGMVQGGRVRAGDLLLRIDPRDYRLALKQAQVQLERAQFELKLEQGRQAVARRDWELLSPELKEKSAAGRELALRVPHLARAQAEVKGAQAALDRARLSLERTTIKAPFDALVRREAVELGQQVAPGMALATLAGTGRFWVKAALPMDRLAWLKLPGPDGEGGASVQISQELGAGRAIRRRGRLLRLTGELDPAGRMAQALIEVDDPLGAASERSAGEPEGADLPMLLGAYVRVEIAGGRLEEAFELPRSALREGDRIWLVDGESRLDIVPVRVAWRTRETVVIDQGLRSGDRVVTSSISRPLPGMALRLVGERAEQSPPSSGGERAPALPAPGQDRAGRAKGGGER